MHVDLVLEVIRSLLDLLAHARSFPLKPIGDMGKLGLALFGGKLAKLGHLPALSASLAEKLRALGRHLPFRLAVGAFIKHLVKPLGAIRLGDTDAVFLLVGVFVVGKTLANAGVDFLNRHIFKLLGGEDLSERGMEGDLSLPSPIPEGTEQVVAAMHHRHNGYLAFFYERAERLGHICRGADGRVSRLGVHTKHVAAFKHLINGLN